MRTWTLSLALATCTVVACSGGDDKDTDTDVADTDVGGSDDTDDGGSDDTDVEETDEDTDVAVPSCSEYCTTIMSACTGDNAQYPDADTCASACAIFPVGNTGDAGGNTLGCRQYHADVAVGMPAGHCVHAGPSGGDMCGSWEENYCFLIDLACTGDDAQFEDAAACGTAAGAMADDGTYGEALGDNIQCRISYALESFASPTSCDSAGVSSEECTPPK